MELLVWGPTAAVTSLAWYDGGRAAVRSLLDTIDSVEAKTLVERDGGTYAFTVQAGFELDPNVMDIVERAHVAFVPPIIFEANGDARFEAVGEQSSLSAFYDALAAEIPVQIEHVQDFHRQRSPPGLTDRQLTVLETAVAIGYYDVPRSGNLEAIATELGCAPSTAGELLRKAERAVLTEFVGRM
jgi:predicted DNA binding protein